MDLLHPESRFKLLVSKFSSILTFTTLNYRDIAYDVLKMSQHNIPDTLLARAPADS